MKIQQIIVVSFCSALIASCTGSYYGVAQKEDALEATSSGCTGELDCKTNYCKTLEINKTPECSLRTDLAFVDVCPAIIKAIKSSKEQNTAELITKEKAAIATTETEIQKEPELCKVFDIFDQLDCKIDGTANIQTNDFLVALLRCAELASSCKLNVDLAGLHRIYSDCKAGLIRTFDISCEEEEQKCVAPLVYNEETKRCECVAPFVYSLKTGTCACPAGTTYNLRTKTCDPTATLDPCNGKCVTGEICVVSQSTFSLIASCQKIPCKTATDCPEGTVCGREGLCTKDQQILQLLE